MAVRLTSPVLGQAVGFQYTGNLESWLKNEGYAVDAATLPDAWANDSDGILGAKAPTVTVTPTAAVLVASVNAAATVGTSGDVIFGTKDGVRTTVALLAADTAAGAATKIDTALAGKADAAIVSSKLNVTSIATGPKAYVTVVGGNAAVLVALGVAVGDEAWGGDGRPAGASNLGVQAAPYTDSPENRENREAPYWPVTTDRHATIANDAAHLNLEKTPAPDFDFDLGGVDTEAPSDLVLDPTELPLAGGTVHVTGNNLEGITNVTVGGTNATDEELDFLGDGVMTFLAPAKIAGTYDVVFVDASGNTTVTGGLTYA